jgi:integrase/recombinase XerD
MVDPYWARVRGPLEPYADGLRGELERLGYTPRSAAGHVQLVAHLSRWMIREGLAASALTPATVDAYFAERRAAGYYNSLTARSVRQLLEYLRALGALAVSASVPATSPCERLLSRYRDYLLVERGLATSTVELNVRMVRPFLADHVRADDGQLDLERLGAGEVGAFVVAESRKRPRSAGRLVTGLRSLLRFLYVNGVIDRPLAEAVPSVPSWSLSGLPKALSRDQVAALLTSCDRSTSTGLRDFAILLLLVRLGLRAGEVAALSLDDLNWRQGEVTVRGKGHRVDRLPLPGDVGQAIVEYLRRARPRIAQGRTVFVWVQAPHRALSSNAVTTVVANAGRRAGLGLIGAHRLRHTAATAMLRAGGSLTEIGQVLRHRRVLTTAVYAKVDQRALRLVARPWPGDVV